MNILEMRAAQSAAVERMAEVLGVYLADTIVTKVLTADELPQLPMVQLDVLGYSRHAQAKHLILSWRRFERGALSVCAGNIFMYTQVQRIRLAFVESLADIVEGKES